MDSRAQTRTRYMTSHGAASAAQRQAENLGNIDVGPDGHGRMESTNLLPSVLNLSVSMFG